MIRRLVPLICIILFVSVPGCRDSADRKPAADTPPAGAPPAEAPPAQATPADLTVTFGSGGGFTGLWEGHTIRADGEVVAWKGKGPGENEVAVGRLSAEEMRTLWEKIQADHFFEANHRDAGNMTTMLRVTVGEMTNEASWSTPAGEPPVPGSLLEIHALCQTLVSGMKPQGDGH